MTRSYADAIKRSVSMRDVCERYGYTVDRRTNKILCPFHDDHNRSLHIYSGDRGYYCFACGAHGDVINFVEHVYNLGFMDACVKLNEDFHLCLGIGERLSEEKRKEAERQYQRQLAEKRRKEQERELVFAIYHAAYNRYTFLDILKRENAPTDPDKPVSPEYIYACQRIDEAWEEVQNAAEQIRKLDAKDNTDIQTMEV